MSSKDYELSDDEEEHYIFIEFDDSVKLEKYSNIHVLGIDTKNPLIQLDNTFFSGSYENPLGTHIFFEEDPLAQTSDLLFDKLPEKSLKYLTKSRKTVKAEHVYIKMKEGTESEAQIKQDKTDHEISAVAFTSVAEAVERFKKDWMVSHPELFNKTK
ncbi:general transcription factor 3C polypeptide 6-like [Pieris brassicae]|uniref:general transcription factor 3C polypeptide 6-like n=1 Tax=Pieris brassicae TaxID=7116 RepID=UPI001E660DD0|nr:general transcription factor 3C polypeptide 6-like [Pieris brassicae]